MRNPQCSLWIFTVLITFFPIADAATETITAAQPLFPNQTIVSAGEVVELGFFSRGNSNKWYVGVWYKDSDPSRTVVWVANRDNPLTNSSSGSLKIGDDGNLLLVDEAANIIVWSSRSNQTSSASTVAQLLDSGNLVVRRENDVDPENYLWQSFDHPTDTFLPGMKLGWDAKTGLNRYLTSWKRNDDPPTGDYSFKIDVHGLPELYLWAKKARVYRTGPWNGLGFSGVPEMGPTYNISFIFVTEKDEISYSFQLEDKSLNSRLTLNTIGVVQRFAWIIGTSRNPTLFWYSPKDQCDNYMECGVYGVCDINASPVCKCIQGFEPKDPRSWKMRNGSGGCVRTSKLSCHGDGFWPLKNMKVPQTSTVFSNKSMSLLECKQACIRDCSCTAYANLDIRQGGSGCVMWSGDLLDMRQYAGGEGGQDLYVRVSAADLETGGSIGNNNNTSKTGQIVMIVGIAVGAGVLLLVSGICFVRQRKRMQRALREKIQRRGLRRRNQDMLMSEGVIASKGEYSNESASDELELPLFDLDIIAMATNNFSDESQLGEGGFGIVYKGMLPDGQRIAVKRLSKNSGQGTKEFKNEVRLIARLQHRNLVRLLGCCIDTEEKMLIYEYMENKSLDFILFNEEKCSLLDWQRRFNIINGIARGLLYLHQDSRFRIIHRDLKASNILLDKEMNPKISDFGLARIFGNDQTEANTKRVVGTYGYMSPEYAMDGLFSIKSDVFSFGVLVLEIITGKKNRGFYNTEDELNLLGHAWRRWREGEVIELVDPATRDSYSPYEAARCLQVGLLCVQERAEDRPSMSAVVLMLSSENAPLAQPKQPAFCLGRNPLERNSLSSKQDESCTVNQVTVTMIDGR
ncbi:LOW QUALITY PROTEIN: receptor-like serine/threonine-protein kinase SD1-8 [Diospyros lotus]|uniref:LOW QUALITY PROTEIN: receptor-like serine/threonine-protein kinase SD1-8 n=1 Tax=Diospyros lotus TaxID=55363 RepID=UPI00224CD84F|nr:LOW QUALITY PROTEIN: receptor-like serine/threonine-protein kinase SD1-8 [Diospyros lotus]